LHAPDRARDQTRTYDRHGDCTSEVTSDSSWTGRSNGGDRPVAFSAHTIFTIASATARVDAGFWPVTSFRPTTTCSANGAALVYRPPAARSASSSRNGTTSVSFTAASSAFENPVTG